MSRRLLSILNISEQEFSDLQGNLDPGTMYRVVDASGRALRTVTPDGQVVGGGEVNLSRYMRNSTDFSYGMRAAIEELLEHAATRKARSYAIVIPEMAANWDGETIHIPAFAKFKTAGGLDLNCAGADDVVFWVRSDLPGFVPVDQNIEGGQQLGRIFDTGGGAIVLSDGLRTSGGVALRVGSGDGVLGDEYTGSHDENIPYTFFMEIAGIAAKGFDHGIEQTNMHNFCLRFQDIRVDGGNKAYVSSSATGFDFGELTTFERVFFSNNFLVNVEVNAAHQLSFNHSSLTFCRGGNIDLNADLAQVLFNSGRFEGGEYISKSSGAYPRAILSMSNTWVVPSSRPDGVTTKPHHMRKFWQGQHQVRGSGVVFHMGGVTPFDTEYAASGLFFCADTTTDIKIDQVAVLQRSASVLKAIPITSRNSLLRNASFTGNINGWTRGGGSSFGTVAYQAGDGVLANGCLSVSITAQQGSVFSDRVPAVAGRKYGSDALFKLLSSPTPTATFVLNMRLSWYGHGSTVSLSNNPFTTTTAGSGNVSVTHNSHGLATGDIVNLAGAATVDGITGAQLTGSFAVTVVNANTYQITTTGSATAGAIAGGGASVTSSVPYTYLGSSAYATQSRLSSDPDVYDTWLRHGGTGIVEAPSGTTHMRLEVATNVSHTGTYYMDEAMLVEY